MVHFHVMTTMSLVLDLAPPKHFAWSGLASLTSLIKITNLIPLLLLKLFLTWLYQFKGFNKVYFAIPKE